MKKTLLPVTLLISLTISAQSLQSPSEFLGYELGTKFTRHHRIVDYFTYVSNVLPNVKLQEYGRTNEGRPLVVAILSSQENYNNLEQIREDNLKRTGLVSGSGPGRLACDSRPRASRQAYGEAKANGRKHQELE